MDREQQADAIVRIVELGRPIAISDNMVLTLTPHSKGKVKASIDMKAGCGVALMASRIGKSQRPGRPPIRRMD